jgi:hypothetical protein
VAGRANERDNWSRIFVDSFVRNEFILETLDDLLGSNLGNGRRVAHSAESHSAAV